MRLFRLLRPLIGSKLFKCSIIFLHVASERKLPSSMSHFWKCSILSLLQLLLISVILKYSNAASLIHPPQADGIWPNSNFTDLSASNNRRFIQAVKMAYDAVTASYPKAYLVGLHANTIGPAPTTRYSGVRLYFTNLARPADKDRGIIVSMGPNGRWNKPVFRNEDYGVGNKYLFRSVLALDVSDADTILRKRYPRADYKAFYLYQPMQLSGMADQPYWIFSMVNSILWDQYLWVGVYDWKVGSTNALPESVTRASSGMLTVS